MSGRCPKRGNSPPCAVLGDSGYICVIHQLMVSSLTAKGEGLWVVIYERE